MTPNEYMQLHGWLGKEVEWASNAKTKRGVVVGLDVGQHQMQRWVSAEENLAFVDAPKSRKPEASLNPRPLIIRATHAKVGGRYERWSPEPLPKWYRPRVSLLRAVVPSRKEI